MAAPTVNAAAPLVQFNRRERDRPHILPLEVAARLLHDIAEDRAMLLTAMDRLGIEVSPTRRLGGWFAEKLSMFKVALDDPAHGALQRGRRSWPHRARFPSSTSSISPD